MHSTAAEATPDNGTQQPAEGGRKVHKHIEAIGREEKRIFSTPGSSSVGIEKEHTRSSSSFRVKVKVKASGYRVSVLLRANIQSRTGRDLSSIIISAGR